MCKRYTLVCGGCGRHVRHLWRIGFGRRCSRCMRRRGAAVVLSSRKGGITAGGRAPDVVFDSTAAAC